MKSFFDKLYKGSKAELFSLADKNLTEEKKMFVVTANPEAFMQGKEDEGLRSLLLDEETTVVADGIGIVKGAQMLGVSVTERIPGVDLAEHLLISAHEKNKSVFLLGAKQEVLDTLCQVINQKYSGLVLLGAVNGYVQDKDAVFEEIKALKPDVVLVALGIPAQEKLIYKHFPDFDKGIFVGVGGSLDVLSGTKARAPKFFIKCNLEWLYRLLKEPSRIKRFYNNNVRFIFSLRKIK